MRSKDESFIKLCEEINFNPDESFDSAKIINVEIDNKTHEWFFSVAFEKHIDIKKYIEFRKALTNRFPNSHFELIIENVLRDKKIIVDYLNYYLSKKSKGLSALKGHITEANISLNENELILTVPSDAVYDDFLIKKDAIKEGLVKIGYGFYNLVIKLNSSSEYVITDNFIKKMVNQFTELKKNDNEEVSTKSTRPQYNRRSDNTYVDIDIASIYELHEELSVATKGEIFLLESRKLKTGKTLYTMSISDYNEAIVVKKFLNEDEELPPLKIGDTVIIKGRVTEDSFSKTKVLMANNKDWYIKTDGFNNLEKDYEEVQRIELATRTKMSAQDGVTDVDDYFKTASFFNQDAVAITDLDTIQAYPLINGVRKSYKNIKPIYGVTLSTVDSNSNILYGYKEFNLKNEEYVVFDLETTGLSPRFDEIIEFGATIVKNGLLKEKIQFFMKPSQPLSAFTINLTNITDEMVSKGLSQEEGINKIYEILKGRVCVAHNASFDINFCKQKFVDNNLDTSYIIGIDTLALSRFFKPDERKHNLGALAKRLGVSYDSLVAHRADYDAEVLARIWVKIIDKLKNEYGVLNSEKLSGLKNFEMLARRFSYESRVLVKNQSGLKKLFKLMSKVLTDQYNEGPQLYFNEIGNDEDLLFGSGTHKSYLWEQIFNGTDENINKAISLYDYIELPPISTFEYLVHDGNITYENLKFAYKDLIEKATKLNKICVAVSDCRYIYDYQKLVYDIYINAPSLGGGTHWLKKYSKTPKLKYYSTTEMLKEFAFLNDGLLTRDIVINNTRKIAEMISDDIKVIKDKLYFPNFDNSPERLKEVVYKNLKVKYGDNPDPTIVERIEKELNPIIKYGYSVTYWISYKLVQKSNQDGYIVGSRGSVGSSIVANIIGISEVNPLKPHYLCNQCKHLEWYEGNDVLSGWDLPNKKCPNCNIFMKQDGHNIPFETFLGFEANKVPDIDLNFSGDYQSVIHNYVKELFGETHTLRAGTISAVQQKTAFGFCKKYEEEQRKSFKPWSRGFLEFLSVKAAGVKRTTGQHPGGIIVIPKEYDIEDFTPINFPANDDESQWKTSHFDYRAIHDNVLKLDLLGHDNPTVVKMLEDLTNTNVDIHVPKFDPEVMKLFYSTESMNITPDQIGGETTGAYGLPEFGTNFVRKMLKDTRPQSFNDLILLSGLSHGTDVWAGNAELLVKQGKELKDCVCCRDDIMDYLIKKDIDKLKSFEIMERVRKGKGLTDDQEQLLIENNVPDWYIESLKKIKYMFPKAHAAAYVIMAWRIAWYKLYHPLAFYASYYTNRPDAIDIEIISSGANVIQKKLDELRQRMNGNGEKLSVKENALIPTLEITLELYARGFKVKNVDLKRSEATKWIIDEKEKALIPPFVVVDGLGETVAQTIIQQRDIQPFISIEDLRMTTSVNSKILGELQRLGVLDELDETNQMTLF